MTGGGHSIELRYLEQLKEFIKRISVSVQSIQCVCRHMASGHRCRA